MFFYSFVRKTLYIHTHGGKYYFGRREFLHWAAVDITYISGGSYYLHLRRELLLTLAVSIIIDIIGGSYYLHDVA